MRQYRNTKTGAVILVASEIKGDWEEITDSPLKEVKEEQPKKKRTPKKK